ncbi:hypothetical protein ACWECR_42980, partial [Streptomyces sp. NPDC005056]
GISTPAADLAAGTTDRRAAEDLPDRGPLILASHPIGHGPFRPDDHCQRPRIGHHRLTFLILRTYRSIVGRWRLGTDTVSFRSRLHG